MFFWGRTKLEDSMNFERPHLQVVNEENPNLKKNIYIKCTYTYKYIYIVYMMHLHMHAYWFFSAVIFDPLN